MLMLLTKRKFLAAAACGLLGASVVAQTADAPPNPEPGDKWTYRFTNMGDKKEPYLFSNEVKSVDGGSAWLYGESQQPNAQPPKYVWRYDIKRAELMERFEFDAAAPQGAGKRLINRQANEDSLQFPLTVGKTYTVKLKWDSGAGHTEYKVEVQAFEKVKVEAGEFDAFRIKYAGFWTYTGSGGGSTGRAEFTRWYAPMVKAHVKSTYSDWNRNGLWNQNITELVKWEPAKR